MNLLPSKGKLATVLYSLWPSLGITSLLFITSRNSIGWLDLSAAFLILLFAWNSYLQWRAQRKQELPIFAMVAFVYWLYYAVQLFWGEFVVSVTFSALGRPVVPEKITEAMLMTLFGVACVWLGMRTRIGQFLIPKNIPALSINPGRWHYIRGVLVIGSLASIIEPSFTFLGVGARQPVTILLSTVPLLAFTILFRRLLQGIARPIDKILVLAFLLTRSVAGLSSGWLGSFASIIVLCGAIYTLEKQRIPRFALVAVIACIMFFQVGKTDFRRAYWSDQSTGGQIERVGFWVNSSLTKWSEALSDPSGETLSDTLSFTLARVSLLAQTGDVLDQTPNIVPYQYGRLYSYMVYTWIPRAIWPDKPSMNEANQFYQVAYGVTEQENLDKVSIAVGVLTEAYINFGWPGVVCIMLLMGIFFDFYGKFFFSKGSGLVLTSLGIVLLPQMLAVESQMAQYLGGIVQQAAFALLILLPAIRLRRKTQAMAMPAFQYSR